MTHPIRPTSFVLALALALDIVSGQEIPTSEVRTVADAPVYPGQTFLVTVELAPDDSGTEIGSYAAVLEWDPLLCPYQEDRPGPGPSPLSNPLVNRADVDQGTLRFAAADPAGTSGPVELLRVDYRADGLPGESCSFTVYLTSLYEAGSFLDLLPGNRSVSATVVLVDARYSLMATQAPPGTVLNWVEVPVTGRSHTYDVIRGDLGQVRFDPLETAVELGSVICIENDSSDTTTAGGHEDPETPAQGEAFFYVFRVPGEPYGESSDGLARHPLDGDCAPP